jgi:hypothetical protein
MVMVMLCFNKKNTQVNIEKNIDPLVMRFGRTFINFISIFNFMFYYGSTSIHDNLLNFYLYFHF